MLFEKGRVHRLCWLPKRRGRLCAAWADRHSCKNDAASMVISQTSDDCHLAYNNRAAHLMGSA